MSAYAISEVEIRNGADFEARRTIAGIAGKRSRSMA
jgi:hypothetical protein